MIQHHTALDFFSEESAPASFPGSEPGSLRTGSSAGQAETQAGVGEAYPASSIHSLQHYAQPLSTAILLVASIIATVAFIKVHREAMELRRVRDRYRAFMGRPLSIITEYPACIPLPVALR